MSAGAGYTAGPYHFSTRAAMEAAVHQRLEAAPRNRPFVDDLLLAVINEHHADVIAAGQCATQLQALTYDEQRRRGLPIAATRRISILMMASFEPLGEWRDCTVYPWKRPTPRADLKQALRTIINAYLPRPEPHHRCVMPGCPAHYASLEYQHVAPTFNEIAEACLTKCSAEEIEGRFGYNKFTAPASATSMADIIPATHPAVVLLLRLHVGNQWGWLCPDHHRPGASATNGAGSHPGLVAHRAASVVPVAAGLAMRTLPGLEVGT